MTHFFSKVIWPLIKTVLTIYVLILIGLYFLQSYMIYPGRVLPFEETNINQYGKWKPVSRTFETEPGVSIQAWHIERAAKPTPLLVFLGPNAMDAVSNVAMLDSLEGYSSLTFNYRDFGKSTGTPSEGAIVSDTLKIIDQVLEETNRKPEDVILVGASLGSGVAVQVAAARNVNKMLLLVPFDSLLATVEQKIPWLPISLLLKDTYKSDEFAPNVKCPVYIFAAEKDEVIPVKHAQSLSERFSHLKFFKIYPGVGHNNILGDADGCYDDFLKAIYGSNDN